MQRSEWALHSDLFKNSSHFFLQSEHYFECPVEMACSAVLSWFRVQSHVHSLCLELQQRFSPTPSDTYKIEILAETHISVSGSPASLAAASAAATSCKKKQKMP